MSSPSKCKKLKQNKTKMYGYRHKATKKSAHGLFLKSELYTLKNKMKISKLKRLYSFGTISYISATYKETKKKSKSLNTLLIIDTEINKVFSKYELNYNGKTYKLQKDPTPTLLTSKYIVPDLKIDFNDDEVSSINTQIKQHQITYNKEIQNQQKQNGNPQYLNEYVQPNDEVFQFESNDIEDENLLSLSDHKQKIKSWKKDMRKLPKTKHNQNVIDYIKCQIKTWEDFKTITSEQCDEIDIKLKELSIQAQHNATAVTMPSAPVIPKRLKKKRISQMDSIENANNNKKKWQCIEKRCPLSFDTYQQLMNHFVMARLNRDLLHLQFNEIYCPYHNSINCSLKTHFFPTILARDYHVFYEHANDLKKVQMINNISMKCKSCKQQSKSWKLSRNGIYWGIRCSKKIEKRKCTGAYWIKPRTKKPLSVENQSIIKSQIKTTAELQEEYPGLLGIAPELPDICMSNAAPLQELTEQEQSIPKQTQMNTTQREMNEKEQVLCQLCQIQHNLKSFFNSVDDLKKHMN
eukprot:15182_1